MSSIAVILARGGSKGLREKNAQPLAGKTVLGWTIEHAMGTPGLDRIVLSTDSDELARVGSRYGIDVVLRPPHLCHDTAPVADAVRFTVEADESGVIHHERVAILYGNVPVRPANLTSRALARLTETGCDSVQSLSPVGKRHPYWMKMLGGPDSDKIVPFVDNAVDRRQDLPEVYALDGGVIAVSRDSLFTYDRSHPHTFLGEDRRAVTSPEGAVVDIDTQQDLDLAEIILRRRAEVEHAAGARTAAA